MTQEFKQKIEADLARLTAERDAARELLRRLLVDVEAMQCSEPDVDEGEPDDSYFGPFEVHDMGGVIEWPNLRILATEAAALLAKA